MARRNAEDKLKELQTKAAIEHLRAFEAAKKTRRTSGWLTSNGGPNAEIKSALSVLMQRHQDLVDNDPYCRRAIDVLASNVVGEGIEGAPRGGTKAFARGWDEWASSTLCDFYGRMNFYGLQEMAFRTVAVRGSVLVRQRVALELLNYGMVPLQLQVLEPDWLDAGKDGRSETGTIIGGKQYDDEGRYQGAWLYSHHPGDSSFGRLRMESSFVPAAELLHVYEMRRPGVYTGIPWGTTVLLRARDLADYESAEILKQKLAACFCGFVTDTDLESDREGDELSEMLEPGLLQRLAPGQGVEFADPPKVEGYSDFMRVNLRAIAMGYGITYEALTGDLTSVNFSSGRMGHLEFSRNINRWQWNMLIPQLLDPVARWYSCLAQVECSSRVPRQMTWTPPVRQMVNPAEEIKWMESAVKAGFLTLSEVQRGFGYVPSDLLDELAEDLKAARDRGLALTVDGQMDVGRMQAQAFSETIAPPDEEPSEDAASADGDGEADGPEGPAADA